MFTRPEPTEYNEYYGTYTSKVPDGEIRAVLLELMNNTVPFLLSMGDEAAALRYAPDKWSVKEVVGHVIDIERVFAYRAMLAARGDRTPQAGVEQDELVANSNWHEQTLAEIVSQYQVVRQSTVAFFNSCSDEVATRIGNASGFDFTVRSLAYIIAGHEIHHMGVIRERYIKSD